MTEAEMRDATVPTLNTTKALGKYIDGLVGQQHDYGTCVYAMSMAAVAAFMHVADKLGVTGFQAGCADMDVLRRTRHWKGPAMVLDLSDHLFPQYDLVADVQRAIDKNADWFRGRAAENLKGNDGFAHPDVIAHWRRLAGDIEGSRNAGEPHEGEAESPQTTGQS